jgi:hypothetical protein
VAVHEGFGSTMHVRVTVCRTPLRRRSFVAIAWFSMHGVLELLRCGGADDLL